MGEPTLSTDSIPEIQTSGMSNKDLLEEAGKLFIQNSGGNIFIVITIDYHRRLIGHHHLIDHHLVIDNHRIIDQWFVGSEKISKEVALNCYTALLQNRMASDVLSSTVDPIFEIYGEEGFITLQPYLEIFNNLMEISQSLYS
eukprot:TRINITY_DN3458_c0_g2_i4.p1 TRINITY_DN3458_c0_g2~~TRINITY_DN3458_c0_g2_i4.p1  ORF type:complete len:167 (-),score=38.14 TRINITY_DN3458_c0_g2_i4:75-500(-)